MAALSTAFELSQGKWTDRFERIVLYQRGWRLGGKGASSRGPNGRIEEHGLHLLLGYYDETFDLMDRCYCELDRLHTDPDCPIRTWDDAVAPSENVGLTEREDDRWLRWTASFTSTPGRPGRAGDQSTNTVFDVISRSVRLLVDFHRSLADSPGRSRRPPYISTSPHASPIRDVSPQVDFTLGVRAAALTGLAAELELLSRMKGLVPSGVAQRDIEDVLSLIANTLVDALKHAIAADTSSRRTFQLLDIVVTNLVGIVADRLLTRPEGFAAIDHLDYREWLHAHGADPLTLESPLLRGMYDLVFGYEDANPERPRFSAGLGLQLAARMLLGYSGGIFWKMRAGMGDIIFAPMFQVLQARGVEFRFFHRVDALRLSEDGRSIATVELGVQAELGEGIDNYQPLIRVKDLPCWPAAPLGEQLRHPDWLAGLDLESFWTPHRDASSFTMRAGEDFDTVVFGISLGMVPYVCQDLLAQDPRWRAMVEHVGTVATQSIQLWLRSDEHKLGWPQGRAITVSGFTEPFQTWASMSHLLPLEDWPADDQPRSTAYFCGPLVVNERGAGKIDVDAEGAGVRRRAHQFLERDVGALWPAAIDERGFRWDSLYHTAGEGSPRGPQRLDGQYWRANVDPSDRYVQSLPGTNQYRMTPGNSGFANLVLTGDWTDCGLNAGCVEAATKSGRLAARAVMEAAERVTGVGPTP